MRTLFPPFSRALLCLVALALAMPAGAEAVDFTLTRRYVHTVKYPLVLADIVVMWPGKKSLPHSRRRKHGYTFQVSEAGKAVQGARIVLKHRVQGRGEVLRVVYKSTMKATGARPVQITLSHAAMPGAKGAISLQALGSPRPNGFAVIAFEHNSRKKAYRRYERYKKQGLPTHDGFPRVTEGKWLRGHKGKKWTVLAGIPTQKTVADKLAAFIRAKRWKPRVEAVESDAFEELHLFNFTSTGKPSKDPKWKELAPATLGWLGFSGSSHRLSWPESSARPAKGNQLVLPFLWPSWKVKDLRVQFDHADGFDWRCDQITLKLPAKSVWVVEVKASISTNNCSMIGD